mmetsp:Transcript_20851/g.54198  ORF Transcript_20851/g.54198 Transcript_20851/m.54198 type:complete len:274 (+) Transcript_20851:296-1117(+)
MSSALPYETGGVWYSQRCGEEARSRSTLPTNTVMAGYTAISSQSKPVERSWLLRQRVIRDEHNKHKPSCPHLILKCWKLSIVPAKSNNRPSRARELCCGIVPGCNCRHFKVCLPEGGVCVQLPSERKVLVHEVRKGPDVSCRQCRSATLRNIRKSAHSLANFFITSVPPLSNIVVCLAAVRWVRQVAEPKLGKFVHRQPLVESGPLLFHDILIKVHVHEPPIHLDHAVLQPSINTKLLGLYGQDEVGLLVQRNVSGRYRKKAHQALHCCRHDG